MSELLEKKLKKNKTKRVLKSIILLSLIYALFMLNWRLEVFRLKNPTANYIFFLAVLSIPLILTVLSFWFPKWWMKITSAVFLFPFSLFSIQLGFLIIIALPYVVESGEYAGYTRETPIKMQYYDISIYRYDQFYISLRQEKEFFPGVLLVRHLYSYNNTIKIEPINDNQIKITFQPNDQAIDAENGVKIITLKRFVYF